MSAAKILTDEELDALHRDALFERETLEREFSHNLRRVQSKINSYGKEIKKRTRPQDYLINLL